MLILALRTSKLFGVEEECQCVKLNVRLIAAAFQIVKGKEDTFLKAFIELSLKAENRILYNKLDCA